MRKPKTHYSRNAKRTLCGLTAKSVKRTNIKARTTCVNCKRVLQAEANDKR